MVRIIQLCKGLGRGNSLCKELEVESIVFLLEMGGGGGGSRRSRRVVGMRWEMEEIEPESLLID